MPESSGTAAFTDLAADGAVELVQIRRGAIGAIWRLEISGGATNLVYAAKEFFAYVPTEEEVAAEIRFAGSCRAAGVPSPEAVPFPDGRYVRIDPTTGRGWRRYAWIDGVTPKRRDAATGHWLAERLAAMHRLAITDPEPLPHPFYQRIDVDWPELEDRVVRGLPELAESFTAFRPRLTPLVELVNAAPAGNPIWCHRDVKAENVLQDDAGGRWLVDWDNAGGMADWRELGALLIHHLGSPGRVRDLVASYRRAGGTAEITGPELFATGLSIWLNFLAGQIESLCRPQLSADGRQFAEERVPGLLRNMPSLAVLEQVTVTIA